jgi:hypothetical protein
VRRRRPEPSEFIQGESTKRKERRRRNTFRVGHSQTPQMPSFHNRLLPSAPFLLTRPNILSNFYKGLCLSPPPSPYNPTLLHRFALFLHRPALGGVFYSPFSILSTLFALSRFFIHHASLPPVSHPPYKCFTPAYPFPTQQSPSLQRPHCLSFLTNPSWSRLPPKSCFQVMCLPCMNGRGGQEYR